MRVTYFTAMASSSTVRQIIDGHPNDGHPQAHHLVSFLLAITCHLQTRELVVMHTVFIRVCLYWQNPRKVLSMLSVVLVAVDNISMPDVEK